MEYLIQVRCGSFPSCSEQLSVLYDVGCPSSGNLSGVFPTVEALDPVSLTCGGAIGGLYAHGLLTGVSSYDTAAGGSGILPGSSAFDTSGDSPLPGDAFWYLFKADSIGGSFCNQISTWSTGGIGEIQSPVRDSLLP